MIGNWLLETIAMNITTAALDLFHSCSNDEEQIREWSWMAQQLAANEGRDRVTVRHAKAAVLLAGPEFVEGSEGDG